MTAACLLCILPFCAAISSTITFAGQWSNCLVMFTSRENITTGRFVVHIVSLVLGRIRPLSLGLSSVPTPLFYVPCRIRIAAVLITVLKESPLALFRSVPIWFPTGHWATAGTRMDLQEV